MDGLSSYSQPSPYFLLPMRSLKHPGQSGKSMTSVVPTRTRFVQFELRPGLSFIAALQQQFDSLGAKSGVAEISGGSFSHFAYVMPALSKSPEHAVYFSDRFAPAGVVELVEGCVTYGTNQGKPALHCHAKWKEADGKEGCGHLLPHECIINGPITVKAWLLEDAEFKVLADEETNFSLFQPVASPASPDSVSESSSAHLTRSAAPESRSAYAIRIGANQDVCQTIERICREHSIEQAYFAAGVGSTIGARFVDGSIVEPHVTELYLEKGNVSKTDGRHAVSIDVTMIDYKGGISSGRLLPDENPVLVTMELLLVLE